MIALDLYDKATGRRVRVDHNTVVKTGQVEVYYSPSFIYRLSPDGRRQVLALIGTDAALLSNPRQTGPSTSVMDTYARAA